MTRIFKLTCLFLSILLCFSLAACQGEAPAATDEPYQTFESAEEKFVPESAKELWEKINDTMDTLDSYASKQTMEGTVYTLGNVMEFSSVVDLVVFSDEEYSKSESSYRCEALSVDEKALTVTAYYDGKMYVANVDGTVNQKLCGEMTYERYKELNDSVLNMSDIDFTDCTKSEFEQKDDGSWSVRFEGYTKKTMDLILGLMDLDGNALGAEIEDMQIEALADEQFRCTEMTLRFLFAEEEGSGVKPRFEAKDTFFDYNEAKFDPAELKAEEYTLVEDLAILYELENELEALEAAKKVSFTMEMTNTVDLMGQKIPEVEKSVVTYGVKNGSFYYEVAVTQKDADGNEEAFELKHENGVLSIIQDGMTLSSEAESEEDAKAVIFGLLDAAGYDRILVTGVEKKEDGALLIKKDKLDVELYQAYFEESGITVNQVSQEIYVTMGDDGLQKVQSLIRVTGSIAMDGQREDIVVLMESVLEIQERELSVSSSSAA